jgi:hypothetical protein
METHYLQTESGGTNGVYHERKKPITRDFAVRYRAEKSGILARITHRPEKKRIRKKRCGPDAAAYVIRLWEFFKVCAENGRKSGSNWFK